MTPTPYLFFNGECREAIETYVEIFSGEVLITMLGTDMPPEFPVPEERKGWIMHATLKIGDGELMASDNIMGDSPKMAGSSVMMSLPTVADARAAFDKLAVGGAVEMPFAPTFWSAGFGTVTDRFGVKWMVGSDEKPAEGA